MIRKGRFINQYKTLDRNIKVLKEWRVVQIDEGRKWLCFTYLEKHTAEICEPCASLTWYFGTRVGGLSPLSMRCHRQIDWSCPPVTSHRPQEDTSMSPMTSVCGLWTNWQAHDARSSEPVLPGPGGFANSFKLAETSARMRRLREAPIKHSWSTEPISPTNYIQIRLFSAFEYDRLHWA